MNRRYVVRRLLQVLPAVASILIVTFAVVQAAPGDPVVAVAGESGNEEYYAFMREKSGLDLPVIERFLPESRRSHPQAGAATLLLMRQRASGFDCRGTSGSAPSPRFAARTSPI
mgnify:CR=1 FL=1